MDPDDILKQEPTYELLVKQLKSARHKLHTCFTVSKNRKNNIARLSLALKTAQAELAIANAIIAHDQTVRRELVAALMGDYNA